METVVSTDYLILALLLISLNEEAYSNISWEKKMFFPLLYKPGRNVVVVVKSCMETDLRVCQPKNKSVVGKLETSNQMFLGICFEWQTSKYSFVIHLLG